MTIRFAHAVVIAALAAGAAAPVHAQFKGAEQVDVYIASAPGADLAWALGAMAAPLCKKEMRAWRVPESTLAVFPESSRFGGETGTELKKRFAVADDELVMVAQPVLSPYADAGFKAGDVFPRGSRPTRVPREPRDTHREREWAAFEQDPVLVFTVRRGDQTLQLPVRHQPQCGGNLFTTKSKYLYIQSHFALGTFAGGGSISITYPLLKSLSLREQAIVYAHEIGHTAVGANTNSEKVRPTLAALNALAMPSAVTNELADLRTAKPEQMAQADSTAIWLLSLIGIAPEEYLAVLGKLDALKGGLGEPVFSTVRPLGPERRAAIAEAIAQWQKDKTLPLPPGRSPEAMKELQRHAQETGLPDKVKSLIGEPAQARQ